MARASSAPHTPSRAVPPRIGTRLRTTRRSGRCSGCWATWQRATSRSMPATTTSRRISASSRSRRSRHAASPAASSTEAAATSASSSMKGSPSSAASSRPRTRPGGGELEATQVPVTIGRVRVEPGDWVVGDDDGVVIVPQANSGGRARRGGAEGCHRERDPRRRAGRNAAARGVRALRHVLSASPAAVELDSTPGSSRCSSIRERVRLALQIGRRDRSILREGDRRPVG